MLRNRLDRTEKKRNKDCGLEGRNTRKTLTIHGLKLIYKMGCGKTKMIPKL